MSVWLRRFFVTNSTLEMDFFTARWVVLFSDPAYVSIISNA